MARSLSGLFVLMLIFLFNVGEPSRAHAVIATLELDLVTVTNAATRNAVLCLVLIDPESHWVLAISA